jgi:hypothetical protein
MKTILQPETVWSVTRDSKMGGGELRSRRSEVNFDAYKMSGVSSGVLVPDRIF